MTLEAKQQVCELAAECTKRNWLPATSGNLSVLVDSNPLQFAITRSGADKQHLTPDDVILVDRNQSVIGDTPFKPSAETIVHIRLYESVECGAIVHVHTMYNNLASELFFQEGAVRFANHELLKALGHWENGAHVEVPIVENFHDLRVLGDAVFDAVRFGVPGVLVRNHGIYAWGKNAFEAKRHLEAFEFLFEYKLRLMELQGHISR